jgi:hypothetical protein
MYQKEKVKQFKESAIEEYNNGLIVEKIASVTKVKKTSEDFIQIGVRPLMEDEFLIAPNFDPRLPGIGRMVANGEMDFLINKLLHNPEVRTEKFNEGIKELPKHVLTFDEAVVLISTKFYVEMFTKLMYRIDYEEKYPLLDRHYRIISIPERVLGNKLVIIGKNAIAWKKQLFDNGETLDISIKPATEFGKVDITVRSVNKMEVVDPDKIKILDVGEENGKKS